MGYDTTPEVKRRWYLKAKAEGRLLYQRDKGFYAKQKATAARRYEKLREEFFSEYGSVCACCKEAHRELLTMEHEGVYKGKEIVVGTNKSGKTRKLNMRGSGEYSRLKKLGWPKNLGIKVLCMNCNWATRRNRTCPHTQ